MVQVKKISHNKSKSYQPKPIIVLGMHRSGTSLAAELINRWGAYSGKENQLAGPSVDNPRGYWEYLPLVEFNDELLNALDSAWYVPPSDEEEVRSLANNPAFRKRADQLISEMTSSSRIWYWKDPRLAILLPFWRVFLPELTAVITVRNPVDIIASLKRRENRANAVEPDIFPASAALLLWQRTMIQILSQTQKERDVYFFDYDSFVDDPETSCRRLCRFLNGCYGPENLLKIPLMTQVVDATCRRNLSEQTLKDVPFVSEPQRRLEAFIRRKVVDRALHFSASDFPLYEGWRDYLHSIRLFATQKHSLLKMAPRSYAQLFIDTGRGFNESQSLHKNVSDGPQTIEFEVAGFKGIQRLRFDPLADAVIMKLGRIQMIDDQLVSRVIEDYSTNASSKNGDILTFQHQDPQINFTLADYSGVQRVVFELEYLAGGTSAYNEIIASQNALLELKAQELLYATNGQKTLETYIADKEAALVQKEEELKSVRSDRDDKSKIIAEKEASLVRKEEELKLIINDRDDKSKIIDEKDGRIEQLTSEINRKDITILDLEQDLKSKDKQIVGLNVKVITLGESLNRTQNSVTAIEKQLEHNHNLLSTVESSVSYRIGRFITYPVRRVYDVILGQEKATTRGNRSQI